MGSEEIDASDTGLVHPEEPATRFKWALGYPLFAIGALSLLTGIALNFYWGMLLGLLALAYGALNFTDLWG